MACLQTLSVQRNYEPLCKQLAIYEPSQHHYIYVLLNNYIILYYRVALHHKAVKYTHFIAYTIQAQVYSNMLITYIYRHTSRDARIM